MAALRSFSAGFIFAALLRMPTTAFRKSWSACGACSGMATWCVWISKMKVLSVFWSTAAGSNSSSASTREHAAEDRVHGGKGQRHAARGLQKFAPVHAELSCLALRAGQDFALQPPLLRASAGWACTLRWRSPGSAPADSGRARRPAPTCESNRCDFRAWQAWAWFSSWACPHPRKNVGGRIRPSHVGPQCRLRGASCAPPKLRPEYLKK